jgi:assimilatory nitrate reductase catalytic subunit
MASAVAGYKRAFGADLVPNDYDDLEQAELLVMVGANMAWCHPVLYRRMVQAKTANPNVRVVVIDPRRTASCDSADLFLPLRPGSDVVLFNGLLNYLRREDALDLEFLDAHTEGFGAAMRVAKQSAPSIPAVAKACDLPEKDVAEFYRWFSTTAKVVTLFSQGVNQSSSGTDKVNSIINVHLATGRIGKAGMGPFSLTGQPNAMGGREVGGLANQLAAHMDFDAESRDRVGRFWQATNLASRPGLKAVELFEAIAAGRVRAVWIMSTNPAVSMPDTATVERALQSCEFVVVSDCVRDTDTTRFADVLLPAATWGEKSGTVTNSERRISRQRSFLPLPGEARPDWWIVNEVGRRMGFEQAFDYATPAEIFREHARLSAFENDGSRDFDIGALAALDDAEYDGLAPVRWPAPAQTGAGYRRVFADGRFYTPTGKARLVVTVPRPPQTLTDEDFPFVLNTGRVRDHWHTMTRTGRSAKLSAHTSEPYVQVHTRDAASLHLSTGMLAELASRSGGRMLARVAVTNDVGCRQLFVPMHWNRQFANLGRVGPLIAPVVDPISGQPELKFAAVSLRAYQPAWYGFVLSRQALQIESDGYLVQSKGTGYWRYELAGDNTPAAWQPWAKALLGRDGQWLEYADPAAGRYRGACIAGDKLQGCVFVAEQFALPGREWLGGMFADGAWDETTRMSILAGRPAAGMPDTGPVICTCFSVGRNTLLEAIRSQGLVSAEQIGAALQAGTNCGSCIPELKGLLKSAAGVGA